jgi:hypothetical protein
LTEKSVAGLPFGRTPFDRNFISLKRHWTECRLTKHRMTERPFDRITIQPKQKKTVKGHLTEKGLRLNGNLVKFTFGQMVFRSNGLSVKKNRKKCQKVIRPKASYE